MRIKYWLALVRGRQEILRQVDFLNRQVQNLLSENVRAREAFDRAVEIAGERISEFQEKANELQTINEKMEHSLSGAMQKLEILEEIVIPNLTKQLATYSSDWDRKIAENAVRTGLVESRMRESE